jgi:hypothetical protein
MENQRKSHSLFNKKWSFHPEQMLIQKTDVKLAARFGIAPPTLNTIVKNRKNTIKW